MPARARNLTSIAVTCVLAALLCLVQTASAVATRSLEKTASGNFFADPGFCTGEIAPESQQPQWEIAPAATPTASGRQVWLSADPLGEAGGMNLYGYVGNNPMSRVDRLGLYFGWDDGAFFLGGALIGIAGQGIGDLITGDLSDWEDYAAAGVGGAAGGMTLLYTANPYAAGAVSGAATNLTRQGLKMYTGKQCDFDPASLAMDTGLGTLTGIVAGAKLSGVTAGRGSMLSQFNGVRTKAMNGTLGWIDKQPKVAARMLGGALTGTAAAESTAAASAGAAAANRLGASGGSKPCP